jgi:hypothetical protein
MISGSADRCTPWCRWLSYREARRGGFFTSYAGSPGPSMKQAEAAFARAGAHGGYCTFALTEDAALSVKVQLFVLLPPLEQAPDQVALRPLATVSVTDVPVVNEADPLLPVVTLMPAGADVIRSPLRPLAETVSVALCGGGGGGGGGADADVTVRIAVFVTALSAAEIVTPVEALTVPVETGNTAVCEPTGTVTVAGTAATPGLLLESAIVVAVEAAAASTTTPCELEPPGTLPGLSTKFVSVLSDEPGGLTVRFADRVVPL